MFSFTVRRLIGASAVVCLTASAVVVGSVAVPGQILALPGASESTVVTVNPTRVLDTRYNVGLVGQFQSTESRKLAITGKIPTYVEATATTAAVTTDKVVIPVGATGVIMNVTAVSPTSDGFLSIRPGDATGVPATAGLNFAPGDVVPNAVTVAIPTTGANAGQIDIHYGGAPANTMHVIIDIVGYTTSTGLIDLVNRVTALETSGVKGDKGDKGDDGAAAVDPAQVVWVATSGDNTFPLLSTALNSISDASSSKPYVIRIAPGVYTEPSPVELKSYVDVEGSGQGTTTITCACGGNGFDGLSAAVSVGAITAEIRHLTINNTGPSTGTSTYSIGVYTNAVTNGSFSMNNVTATATGSTNNYGVANQSSSSPSMNNVTATATGGTNSSGVVNQSSSSPSMNNVTATATGGTYNYGVANQSSSSPSMNNVTATATATGNANYGVFNDSSSPSMNNVTATATGGTTSYGVYSYGVYNSSASPSIRNSSITGTPYSIRNSGSTAKVADTVLGGAVGGVGFTCVGVYTTAFTPLGAACVV
jgi:hypothetical protein